MSLQNITRFDWSKLIWWAPGSSSAAWLSRLSNLIYYTPLHIRIRNSFRRSYRFSNTQFRHAQHAGTWILGRSSWYPMIKQNCSRSRPRSWMPGVPHTFWNSVLKVLGSCPWSLERMAIMCHRWELPVSIRDAKSTYRINLGLSLLCHGEYSYKHSCCAKLLGFSFVRQDMTCFILWRLTQFCINQSATL